MTRTFTGAAVAVCALLLLGAAPAQERPKGTPLTEAEYHQLFDGGALLDMQSQPRRWKGSVVLTSSGLALVHWLGLPTGTGEQDMGTWRIDGDSICLKWQRVRSGVEYCVRYHRVGENAYESRSLADGNYLASFSIRP